MGKAARTQALSNRSKVNQKASDQVKKTRVIKLLPDDILFLFGSKH